MPEDLDDKLTDFEMMLEGCMTDKESNLDERYKTRLLSYWYSLSGEIRKKINEKVS